MKARLGSMPADTKVFSLSAKSARLERFVGSQPLVAPVPASLGGITSQGSHMRFATLKYYRRSFIAAALLLLAIVFFSVHNRQSNKTTESATPSTRVALQLPSMHKDAAAVKTAAANDWLNLFVQPGDSIATIFQKQHIPALTLQTLLKDKLADQYLGHIKPNDAINLRVQNGNLLEIDYPFSLNQTLYIKATQDGFKSEILHRPYAKTLLYKSGTIHHSLAEDARAAGLTHNMVDELEQIFASKINFNRNLHTGDTFGVLYEEYFLDGQKVKPGHIMAALFDVHGHTYEAYRYTTPEGVTGYYDASGEGVKPMLMRAPLHYTHISSPFSLRRWHPILHKWRPHWGVDYAAPINTPIHAAGDGRISFMGNGSGYGNMIMIKHADHYTTVYAHMRRFAKGMHVHKFVNKGDTIGYVGMTGLATGPHVHFEIRHLGLRRNPRTIKLPGDKPIPWSDRKDFKQKEHRLAEQMQLLKTS